MLQVVERLAAQLVQLAERDVGADRARALDAIEGDLTRRRRDGLEEVARARLVAGAARQREGVDAVEKGFGRPRRRGDAEIGLPAPAECASSP